MKIIITEEQKDEILSSLQDGINKDVYNHIKRRYPLYAIDPELGFTNVYGKNRILIDDKLYHIKENKKRLVNIILYDIVEDFQAIGIPVLRKTIKKFLDDVVDIDIQR